MCSRQLHKLATIGILSLMGNVECALLVSFKCSATATVLILFEGLKQAGLRLA